MRCSGHSVRMQFLEHLEKWKLEQEELAQQAVARKVDFNVS